MSFPVDLKYSARHLWVRRDSEGMVIVGVTHHAQAQLGDVVFVDCPAPGRQLAQDEVAGIIESVKTASDLHAPVAGVVVAINPELADTPEKVNEDPYGAWMFRMKPDNDAELDALLDAEQYQKLAESDAS